MSIPYLYMNTSIYEQLLNTCILTVKMCYGHIAPLFSYTCISISLRQWQTPSILIITTCLSYVHIFVIWTQFLLWSIRLTQTDPSYTTCPAIAVV